MNVLHHLFGRSVHLRHHRHLTGTDAYTTGLRIEPGCQEALGTVVAGRTAAGAHYEGTAFLVTSSTPATASTVPIPIRRTSIRLAPWRLILSATGSAP
jgi:hypothetical protein